MSNYKKSHYAINKVRKGIVYRNADGSILEITFEKLAAQIEAAFRRIVSRGRKSR